MYIRLCTSLVRERAVIPLEENPRPRAGRNRDNLVSRAHGATVNDPLLVGGDLRDVWLCNGGRANKDTYIRVFDEGWLGCLNLMRTRQREVAEVKRNKYGLRVMSKKAIVKSIPPAGACGTILLVGKGALAETTAEGEKADFVHFNRNGVGKTRVCRL